MTVFPALTRTKPEVAALPWKSPSHCSRGGTDGPNNALLGRSHTDASLLRYARKLAPLTTWSFFIPLNHRLAEPMSNLAGHGGAWCSRSQREGHAGRTDLCLWGGPQTVSPASSPHPSASRHSVGAHPHTKGSWEQGEYPSDSKGMVLELARLLLLSARRLLPSC